ncbi:MAG: endolytic transglycosylase MltG [Actinobacteria bacterium]|nr:endolytic transglycosylase MltG [Actinomycetota bacterium]
MDLLEERRDARHPVDPHRPGRGVFALLLAFLVVVAGGVYGVARYYSYCERAGDTHAPVRFTVPEGQTGEQVVERLAAAHVIRCGGVVGRFILRRSGRADAILAGTYDLTTNMTPDAALAVLTTPPKAVPTVKLTIPEGYTIAQIAERAQQDLGISGKQLLELAGSGRYSLPPYLPEGASSAEGFLFPNTYEFVAKDVTPDIVIRKMLDEFATEAQDLHLKEGARSLGFTPYQVVIVASMIEREAKVAKDRPLIAAVIYNRLAKGMTLGIDATLLYDDPTPGDGTLSQSDLQTDTPYNTRINPGLTPTPIANPGFDSLQAALHPANVDYLYYVLCGADGHHVFSTTYRQFLQNKARCLG